MNVIVEDQVIDVTVGERGVDVSLSIPPEINLVLGGGLDVAIEEEGINIDLYPLRTLPVDFKSEPVFGAMDGINKTFLLSAEPYKLVLSLNGLIERNYTVDGKIITMDEPPIEGDILWADYVVR